MEKSLCYLNKCCRNCGLDRRADPQMNRLIHPFSQLVTPLRLFLVKALRRTKVFIITLDKRASLCGGCGQGVWIMWLSAVSLCFHAVWRPPWPVSERPASPVPAWSLCSWSWLLWGCQPKTSACWSLLTGCCKCEQDTMETTVIFASSVSVNTLGAPEELLPCWRVW